MDDAGESSLASIARRFLAVVRDQWPELLAFCKVQGEGDLVLVCPAPSSDPAAILRVLADVHLNEVIVGFGGGHSHGDAWCGSSEPDVEFAASIALIDGILSEDVVGCTLRSGGGAVGQLDHLREQSFWSNVQSVRSWRGAHDADFGER